MKLLVLVDDMILRQDTSNGLITGIGFHNCVKVSIELDDDGS